MNPPPRHKLLLTVLVTTGFLLGACSIFAIFMFNEARDDQLHRIQAAEAWARYDGQISACFRGNVLRIEVNAETNADIPIVNCYAVTPKPSLSRP